MSTQRIERNETWLRPKLFIPDQAADDGTVELSPSMTLTQFFEAYVVRFCLVDADPKTIKQYRETLRFWARFTGDPPLFQIDRETLACFQDGLKTLPGREKTPGSIKTNTIRKHRTHLDAVLKRAGPESSTNPDGAGLLAKPPWLRKPKIVRNQHINHFELYEIGSILDASHHCPPHRRFVMPGPIWWESIELTAYNVGFRIETLLLLRFNWLEQNQWGWWFRVPEHSLKEDDGWMFYANRHALAAVERMRRHLCAKDGDLIFPWPYSIGWLHRAHKRVIRAAGLPPSRQFGFHGLRRACNTELKRIPIAGAADVARMAMGHRGDVNIDFYTGMKVWAEVSDLLPQPPRTQRGGQLSLF